MRFNGNFQYRRYHEREKQKNHDFSYTIDSEVPDYIIIDKQANSNYY